MPAGSPAPLAHRYFERRQGGHDEVNTSAGAKVLGYRSATATGAASKDAWKRTRGIRANR